MEFISSNQQLTNHFVGIEMPIHVNGWNFWGQNGARYGTLWDNPHQLT